MTIINIESFLKDLKLAEIIPLDTSDIHEFDTSQDNSSASLKEAAFNKILEEVTNRANVSKNSEVTDKISGEIIDIIQLTRRVVYAAIREAKDKNKQVGTTDDEKAEATSKAQKDFDEALGKKLKDYLLEAEVINILNTAYMEFDKSDKGTINGTRPVLSDLINVSHLIEDILVKNVRHRVFLKENFDLDKWLNDLVSTVPDNSVRKYIKDMCAHMVHKIKSSTPAHTRSGGRIAFCDAIFRSDPSAKSEQILSLGEYPEIKEDVLVSFLRIILYPFKFIVDYLEKKRIYGLDELRLFKDGKEKPREKEESASVKQKRLFNYGSLEEDSSVNSLGKDEFLRAVELEKGKKQHYAVFNCFEKGTQPPNGTIIVFHGKNADIHTKPFIDSYKSICEGYRVIMMEYPGFEPSSGPLSKKNISDVTYKLFEDAKENNLIKGNLTIMGEDFGSYYAASLAQKIEAKDPGFCKGLMLVGQFINTTNDLSKFGKIASCISDAEHLDTVSVLRALPRTLSVIFSSPHKRDILDMVYTEKDGEVRRSPYSAGTNNDTFPPALNYKASDEDILENQNTLTSLKKAGAQHLPSVVRTTETFLYGKKPFLATSVSRVVDKGKQQDQRREGRE